MTVVALPWWKRRGVTAALLSLTFLMTMGLFVVTAPLPAFAYDGNAAAAYADIYWNQYNPNYAVMNDDCTNFVSQALHDPYQGGGFSYVGGSSRTDDNQWWMHYDSTWGTFSWSRSFTIVPDFYNFLMQHYPGGYAEGSAHSYAEQTADYTPNSVVTGDVLFYDFQSDGVLDHASIQVGMGPDKTSGYYGNYVDTHSNSHWHAFWSLLPYNSEWAYTTIYFVHVAATNY